MAALGERRRPAAPPCRSTSRARRRSPRLAAPCWRCTRCAMDRTHLGFRSRSDCGETAVEVVLGELGGPRGGDHDLDRVTEGAWPAFSNWPRWVPCNRMAIKLGGGGLCARSQHAAPPAGTRRPISKASARPRRPELRAAPPGRPRPVRRVARALPRAGAGWQGAAAADATVTAAQPATAIAAAQPATASPPPSPPPPSPPPSPLTLTLTRCCRCRSHVSRCWRASRRSRHARRRWPRCSSTAERSRAAMTVSSTSCRGRGTLRSWRSVCHRRLEPQTSRQGPRQNPRLAGRVPGRSGSATHTRVRLALDR